LLEQQDSQLLADLRENFSRDIINYFKHRQDNEDFQQQTPHLFRRNQFCSLSSANTYWDDIN